MNITVTPTAEQEQAVRDNRAAWNLAQGASLSVLQYFDVVVQNALQTELAKANEAKRQTLRERYNSASPSVQAQIEALLP